jgi:hypothetical protein
MTDTELERATSGPVAKRAGGAGHQRAASAKPVRKSVPLDARDLQNLHLVRQSPEALAALGAPLSVTEAALLRLILAQGLERARLVAEEAGYAALARSYQHDPEEQAIRSVLRSRRRVRNDIDGDLSPVTRTSRPAP